MKKYLRSKLVLIGVPALVIVVVALVFVMPYLLPPSSNIVGNEFRENKQIFVDVANYLYDQEYEFIEISPDETGNMYVAKKMNGTGKYIKISDSSISDAVEKMFKLRNYLNITKMTDGIYFQRWANLESSRGLFFSKNNNKPDSYNMTEVKPYAQKGWYFYSEE